MCVCARARAICVHGGKRWHALDGLRARAGGVNYVSYSFGLYFLPTHSPHSLDTLSFSVVYFRFLQSRRTRSLPLPQQ